MLTSRQKHSHWTGELFVNSTEIINIGYLQVQHHKIETFKTSLSQI